MWSIPSRQQWKKWSLGTKASYLGAWFGGFGLLVTIFLIFIPPSSAPDLPPLPVSQLTLPLNVPTPSPESIPSISATELEFEQLLEGADEHRRAFEEWYLPVAKQFKTRSPIAIANPIDCDKGSRLGKRSLELARQIEAIDSEKLRLLRVTKPMAKHEYLTMLYSRSAAVADICQDKLPDSNTRAIYFAHRALAEYDTVLALHRESFAPGAQGSNHPRLLEVALKIVDFTTWYAARAACILYLRGQYDYNDAYSLAQQAYDFAPKELDIWIDEVRKKRRDESPKVTDRKEITL